MILQIKNVAEYDQPITLHTGEAKTIEAGTSIKVNTGTDRRLINFYASLVNYSFDVIVSEASGQEMNSFEDAIYRLKEMRASADRSKSLADTKVYPGTTEAYSSGPIEPRDPYNPKTLLDDKKEVDPIVRVHNPVVIDSKVGEIVPDYSPSIPEDFPEDPNAEAELKRIEAAEAKAQEDQNSNQAKYDALDKFDEDTLKKILYDKFEETTKLRSKWKIIYHIIELIDDAGMDVFSIVGEYEG